MARHWFGGIADYVITVGTDNSATLQPGESITCWNAASGGTQYTDLTETDEATQIADGILTADAAGAIPEFMGPDGIRSLYFDANGGAGPRRRAVAIDIGEDLTSVAANVAALSNPTIEVAKNGTLVGDHGTLNLIEGPGITLNVSDDLDQNRIDITITNSGGGGATTSPRPALAVVYAAGYPAAWQTTGDAYTFICDGTDDQTQINDAIAAVAGAGEGHGDVYLAGDRFNLSGPILIRTGVWLRGGGFATELRAVTDFNTGMITLFDVGTHMTKISDLYLNGNDKAVHGVVLDNTGGVFTTRPPSSPDSAHVVRDLFIYNQGTATFAGYGLLPRGNNHRASKFSSIRILDVTGCGVWVNGSHDSHFTDIEVGASGKNGPAAGSDPAAPVGAGFFVGAGNNMFTGCKAFYSRHSGFYHSTVRASYTGCQSQDNYGYGFEVAPTGSRAAFIGCLADTNGQGLGAGGLGQDGFYLPSSLITVQGCESFDRGEQAWQQQYGIRFTANCKYSIVDAITYDNAAGSTTGTPDPSTNTRIVSKLGT